MYHYAINEEEENVPLPYINTHVAQLVTFLMIDVFDVGVGTRLGFCNVSFTTQSILPPVQIPQ